MQDFGEFAVRERKGWADDGIVTAYIEKFGPVTDRIAQDFAERLVPEGKAVLDLCCGQGNLTAALVAAGADVTGLDFSDEMLAHAAQTAPGADLRQGDATAMPFDDESFDLVICNFGMMHIPDQPAALSEVHRVLRPGGSFHMATWAAPDVSPAFGTVFGAMKAHADVSRAPAQPDLFAFATPDGAAAMTERSGLTVVGHQIVPTYWELSAPDELFEIFLTATVAAAQLIKAQTPEVIQAVKDQITARVRENFAVDGGYRVPVSVAVVAAAKA